jgi:phage shock protein B
MGVQPCRKLLRSHQLRSEQDVSIILEGALVIVLAGIAAIIIALAVKLIRSAGDRASRSEDARIIQELYQGLSRLEKRVESLEAILSERSRKEHNE